MAIAAVGTFLAYTHAGQADTVEVLVATHPLRAGHVIVADDVELVPVELPDEVRGLFGAPAAAIGRVVVAAIEPGEFLLASATVTPTDEVDALEVAVRVPVGRAVGDLRPGERVDVFSTWSSEVTELIAVDARVLDVQGAAGGVLDGGGTVLVRLAVRDFTQVEALVHAQAAGDITMIRARIGSERQDVGRQYRPVSSSTAARSGSVDG